MISERNKSGVDNICNFLIALTKNLVDRKYYHYVSVQSLLELLNNHHRLPYFLNAEITFTTPAFYHGTCCQSAKSRHN